MYINIKSTIKIPQKWIFKRNINFFLNLDLFLGGLARMVERALCMREVADRCQYPPDCFLFGWLKSFYNPIWVFQAFYSRI